ncbi:hypothetical protein LH442_11710 [Laribacter hongkongensis]|uniref:hypothetical protein n=1 Tax=Laribacter hongkongensis TaxID=168471 RepID=UPI001EFE4B53|nr:hypothetical protein [Laribacter hongkongensis]MCG9056635.1 hypothetical protein [Laribacter hongkongensis]
MIVGKLTHEQACAALEEVGVLNTITVGGMTVRAVVLDGKNLLLTEDPFSGETTVVYPHDDTGWWEQNGSILHDWEHVLFAVGEWPALTPQTPHPSHGGA